MWDDLQLALLTTCPPLQQSESKFADQPVHMGLGRHVLGNELANSPNLDSMGTYTADDPPQDEPGNCNIILIINCF